MLFIEYWSEIVFVYVKDSVFVFFFEVEEDEEFVDVLVNDVLGVFEVFVDVVIEVFFEVVVLFVVWVMVDVDVDLVEYVVFGFVGMF